MTPPHVISCLGSNLDIILDFLSFFNLFTSTTHLIILEVLLLPHLYDPGNPSISPLCPDHSIHAPIFPKLDCFDNLLNWSSHLQRLSVSIISPHWSQRSFLKHIFNHITFFIRIPQWLPYSTQDTTLASI